MAKYNRVDAPLRMAKEYNNIAFNNEIGEKNTLKTFNKIRENNKLYQEGMALGANGGNLEEATELVEENGIEIPKKEHRNFKAGYKRGLEIFKNNLENNNSKTR